MSKLPGNSVRDHWESRGCSKSHQTQNSKETQRILWVSFRCFLGMFLGCWTSFLGAPLSQMGWEREKLGPAEALLLFFSCQVMSNSLRLHGLYTPSYSDSWCLLGLMSIKSVMLSNHLILCCPLLLLPSILPSIRVFSDELTLHVRWP